MRHRVHFGPFETGLSPIEHLARSYMALAAAKTKLFPETFSRNPLDVLQRLLIVWA